MSSFFFCHNICKSGMLQRRRKASVCGEGLNVSNENSHCYPSIFHILCGLLLTSHFQNAKSEYIEDLV